MMHSYRVFFSRIPASLPWVIVLLWLGWLAIKSDIPVIVFDAAGTWNITDSSVEATITGYKIRDCSYIKDSAVGYAEYDYIWNHVHFEFLLDKEGRISRPIGHHSFGSWKWQDEINGVPTRVMATVKYLCDTSIVNTTFGPFVVGN